MTDSADRILNNGRLITALVLVLVVAGIASYLTMSRQENPSFPYRGAIVVVPFPGASAERIERLVVEPLENEVGEIPEISNLGVTIEQDVAVLSIELKGTVYNTNEVWDRLRVAVDAASERFPDGVLDPRISDRIVDSSTLVAAVTGNASPMALADAARTLETALLSVDGVASADLYGDPGRQVTIKIEDAAIQRYGLSLARIARDINNNNQVKSGGSIRLSGASVSLNPETDFDSIEQIREVTIGLPQDQTLPLSSLAEVEVTPVTPPNDMVWYNGTRAVAVEVVAARGVNVVELGERLRAKMAEVEREIAPLQIDEMFYQPALTEARLNNLSMNLLASISIILGVLLLFMGWRMGVAVALLLPLVTLSAIAVYAMGGGVLQQIAIIGLVVALGVLVDNAIVITEETQYWLNQGRSPREAGATAIRSLAGPLFAATGTTVAAFVPVLIGEGNTADFVRSLPLTIILALVTSYIFAVTVTPLIALRILRPVTDTGKKDRLNVLGDRMARLTLRYPRLMIGGSIFAVLASLAASTLLSETFFPDADQDIVVIDLQLRDGAYLSRTEQATRDLTAALRERAGVEAIYAFIGTGGPPFYYNLQKTPQAANLARIVVRTDALERNAEIIRFIDKFKQTNLPDATVIARKLSQGPLVAAPIEVNIFNDDAGARAAATRMIYDELRQIEGARNVRHSLGVGVPNLDFAIDDGVARSFDVSGIDVANALQSRSDGLIVGEYRGADEPMFIRLRSPEGSNFDPADLETINIYNDIGYNVPLMQVATPRLSIAPGGIERVDQQRMGAVLAELGEDVAYSEVLSKLKTRTAGLDLPDGTRVRWLGFDETSGQANHSLFGAAPIGIGMLLLFLLFQFNSFKRVGLVLLTVPFALVGVIPGLLLLGIPFGFMPLVGLFALVGIVVNNAIVMIDVMDQRLQEGADLDEAIGDAVRRRTRPVLLTTATTVAGLLPLAFTSATLWPPMAWSIITGLLASTLLTLLALPAFCRVALSEHRSDRSATSTAMIAGAALLAATMLGVGGPAQAQDETRTVTFQQSLRMAAHRASVQSDRYDAQAAQAVADQLRRISRYPTLSVQGTVSRSDERPQLEFDQFGDSLNDVDFVPIIRGALGDDVPINEDVEIDGDTLNLREAFSDVAVPIGERETRNATVALRQPLVNFASQRYLAPAAGARAIAALSVLQRARMTSMVEASDAYIDALSADARLSATQSLIDNISGRVEQVQALRRTGNALQSEVLAARYALRQAQQRRGEYVNDQRLARLNLGRMLGSDHAYVPVPLTFVPPVETRSVNLLTEAAMAQRDDLAALDSEIRAAEMNRKAVTASRLPTLDAVASLNYQEGNALLPEEDRRIGLQLSWTPFAGGAISARKTQADASVAGLRAQRMELIRGIRLQVRRALADLENARSKYQTARFGLESAAATVRTRTAQRDVGQLGIQEVLDAQATLAERQAEAEVALYRLTGAWVSLQGMLGERSRLLEASYHRGRPPEFMPEEAPEALPADTPTRTVDAEPSVEEPELSPMRLSGSSSVATSSVPEPAASSTPGAARDATAAATPIESALRLSRHVRPPRRLEPEQPVFRRLSVPPRGWVSWRTVIRHRWVETGPLDTPRSNDFAASCWPPAGSGC